MRATVLLAYVLLTPFLGRSQSGTSAAQKSGQAACDDDYLATLNIPLIAIIDPSAKTATFPGSAFGIQVDVATPSAYINLQRDNAKKYMTEYSGPSDKDKLAVLRVVVHPPAEAYPDDPGDRSIYNVVLRSGDNATVIHPICSAHSPLVRYGNSAMTATGIYAVFTMKDVEDLLSKGDVSITYVFATGKAIDRKLDKKKLAMLGLSGGE